MTGYPNVPGCTCDRDDDSWVGEDMGQFDAPTNDCIGGGCEECENAEAPTPSDAEVGAVSAIADHSTSGISGPLVIDPPVEADGAAQTAYDPQEARARIRALAEARLANRMDGNAWGRFLDAAFAVADLLPIAECPACERLFVPHDGRQKTYCSVRCQQRINKRRQRSRIAASPVTASREEGK